MKRIVGTASKKNDRRVNFLQTTLNSAPKPAGTTITNNIRERTLDATFNLVKFHTDLENKFIFSLNNTNSQHETKHISTGCRV